MILEETINRFIRDIVDNILNVDNFAIKSQQNAPRPPGAYADVHMVSDNSIGWEQSQYTNRVDVDLNQNITGMREIMLSVGFYRTSSMDNGSKVRTGLLRESVQELFRAANLGLIRRSQIRQISSVLENGWEEKSQFDIFISAVGTDTDIVRSISSVDINFVTETNDLIYSEIIEIG